MIRSELIQGLVKPLSSERRLAAQEIGESGDPEAAALLLARLKLEATRAVKEAILRGLANIWSAGPIEPLIELLRDSDPFVRAEATAMLRRRAEEALVGLVVLSRDADKDLRKFSIDILGQTIAGIEDSIYLAALADPDINVVISAVENIGLGRRSAFRQPIVAIALSAVHPMTVCACLETLTIIGEQETLDTIRTRFPHATTVEGIYQPSFLKLLGNAGGVEVFEEICAVMTSQGNALYPVAIDALSRVTARHKALELPPACEGALCDLLGSELDPGVRYHLIRLLGHFKHSEMIATALPPAMHDQDNESFPAIVEGAPLFSDPGVSAVPQAFPVEEETDIASAGELLASLDEIPRRPRAWNSQPNNSAS